MRDVWTAVQSELVTFLSVQLQAVAPDDPHSSITGSRTAKSDSAVEAALMGTAGDDSYILSNLGNASSLLTFRYHNTQSLLFIFDF